MLETERYQLDGAQLMDEITVASVLPAVDSLMQECQTVAASRT